MCDFAIYNNIFFPLPWTGASTWWQTCAEKIIVVGWTKGHLGILLNMITEIILGKMQENMTRISWCDFKRTATEIYMIRWDFKQKRLEINVQLSHFKMVFYYILI